MTRTTINDLAVFYDTASGDETFFSPPFDRLIKK